MTPPRLPDSLDPVALFQWLSGLTAVGFVWLFHRDEKLKSYSIDHKLELVVITEHLKAIDGKLDRLLGK